MAGLIHPYHEKPLLAARMETTPQAIMASPPAAASEPRRVSRRLRLLRDWSHDEIDEVFS
jgi:hypothetical protein